MSRFIQFEAVENARDMGGLHTAHGHKILSGKLLRSGNLSRATDADLALLRERFKISDVFDFRFEKEAAADPDRRMPFVRYTSLPTLPLEMIEGFSSGRGDSGQENSRDFVASLVRYASVPQAQALARRLYPSIITSPESQKCYGEFLRGVLYAPGGSLWHCSQGKDRAGLASAYLLAALGADRETIVADFAESNNYYRNYVEQLTAQVRRTGGDDAAADFILAMVGVSVKNFCAGLDLIDSTYGSLNSYIHNQLGFTPPECARLRERYLE